MVNWLVPTPTSTVVGDKSLSTFRPQHLYYAAIIAMCQANEASLTLDKLQLLQSNVNIRESVDSLYRDGADAQYMQYFKQKQYNFTTNTLKLT